MNKEYPHMMFRRHWEITAEMAYGLGQCHAIIEAVSGSPILPEYQRDLLQLSLIKGAQATTAIEGNTLSLDEVQRVYNKEALPPGKKYQEIEVRNILDAFNVILRQTVHGDGSLITPDLLRQFHRMIGRDLGPHFAAVPGEFATAPRIVGPYRAPDHEDVPELVARLCAWLAKEFHYEKGQTLAEAIVQAIVAHVYIEWIHPFSDGNGRTGRLVEFFVLVRAGCPNIASHLLSNHYNETRPEYYRLLDQANTERDLTCFLDYAIKGFKEGLLATLEKVHHSQFHVSWMRLVHDRFARRPMTNRNTFARQRAVVLEMSPDPIALRDVPRISHAIGSLYEKLSERTLVRDMEALKEMGLVVQTDEGEWRPNTDLLKSELAVRRQSGEQSERPLTDGLEA